MYNLQRSPSRLILTLALIAILAGLMPVNVQDGLNSVQARTTYDQGIEGSEPWPDVRPASVDQAQTLQSVEDVASASIESDDFNECQLDSTLWAFRDPTASGAIATPNGKQLVITVPEQKDYNLYLGANNAARVTQSVSNADFQIVAKFESNLLGVPEPSGAFKMEGIIVEGVTTELPAGIEHDELLRFEFYSKYRASTQEHELWAYGAWMREDSIVAHLKEKIYTVAAAEFPSNADPEVRQLRVTRQARTDGSTRWIMEYKLDDGAWQPVDENIPHLPGEPNGSFVRNLDLDDAESPGAIGVYAGSTATDPTDPINGAPGHIAIVDYFFESDSVISPEDARDYDVTTGVVGSGAVDVDDGPYACGDSVTFEAMPDTGWAFTEWSGDLFGSTNPNTVPFQMGMDVTASFTQTASTMYPLNVTIQGNGQVAKNPNATEYEADTEVVLTATADAGHRFVGWSGDEVSTNSPVTVTMNSAKSIVAEFEEIPVDTYTLDIQVFPTDGSGGTATKSPDQSSYSEDTQVTLTATPNAGYEFNGWTGLITSSDAVVNVNMPAQNSVVLASFVVAEYTVNTQSNGNGSVSVSPQKTSYRYGDQITITATPGSGWSFFSWGGDVGGSDNPQTVTITDNTNIIATFNGGQRMTYLPLVNR